MSRKFKVSKKSLPKTLLKIGAGVLAIGGVAAIAGSVVDYVKDDTKTIHPIFEVGELSDTDGKYIKNDLSLYTKESFYCNDLQIVSEFDSKVEYQITWYDDVDKFISTSEWLSDSFNSKIEGVKARLEIRPVGYENEKISFFDKYSLSNDINVKVSKQEKPVFAYLGDYLYFTTDYYRDLNYKLGSYIYYDDIFIESDSTCISSNYLLNLRDIKNITLNFESTYTDFVFSLVYFKNDNGVLKPYKTFDGTNTTESIDINSKDYVLIQVHFNELNSFSLDNINNCITVVNK